MMGCENDEGQEAHLYTSTQAMESLVLDQSAQSPFMSNSDYKSVMSSYAETVQFPVSEDPLSQQNGDSQGQSRRSFRDSPFLDESYVDPPSYADVVFTPFGEEPNSDNGIITEPSSGDGTLSFGSRRISHSASDIDKDYLSISVSDPQKEIEATSASLVPGTNTYFTYLVHTQTNMGEFGGTEFSVRRRFRDVVTLADRLAESYRGFFVPPRPDKNVVESQVMQKQEFIEQRRLALEKYLCKLAVHPVIRKSVELRLFLQVQGKLPLPGSTDMASRMLDGAVKLPKQLFGEGNSSINAQEVSHPAKGGRDLLRIFKEIKQSMTNDWGAAKPLLVEEDKEFLEKKEQISNLEQQLSSSSQQAEALVKAQQDLSETMGNLGLAFMKLSKFETEAPYNANRAVDASSNVVADYNSQRVAEAKRIASTAVKASRLHREANAQSVKNLDKLHEYLATMQAVHTAFGDRSNALLTVQTLLSDLSNMNTRVDKLTAAASKIFGGDRTRYKKIEELKETITETERARDCAVKEYERIKENNKTELTRFETERKNDFSKMLKGFVYNQVGYMEKISSVWEKLAEETKIYAEETDNHFSFGSAI